MPKADIVSPSWPDSSASLGPAMAISPSPPDCLHDCQVVKSAMAWPYCGQTNVQDCRGLGLEQNTKPNQKRQATRQHRVQK